MEIPVTQTADQLQLESPMPAGRRILFLILALFPLLAPYELLVRTRWSNPWSFFFLLAAAISAGAAALSLILVWAAIAGLRTVMRFDKSRSILFHIVEAPVLRRRVEEVPFSEISELRIQTHEWSDGAPSYSFGVVLRGGRLLRLGSSWSKAEVEAVRERVAKFLGFSTKVTK